MVFSLARSTRSMHIHAAVDANRLAGHEVAVIGREKDYRAYQILRVLIALNRATLSSICQLLGGHDAFLICAGNGQARHD